MVTNKSRLTPWGGFKDEEWTDTINKKQTFTGVLNVSSWSATQILKSNGNEMFCWSSDIYGNQYGLFKELSLSSISVVDRYDVPGELWTRTNNQMVSPAKISLSGLFTPFQSLSSSLYADLTGSGIKYTDCYFDTLFIETSAAVIYAKIDYNYEDSIIEFVFDDVRIKSLSSNIVFEQNWFFPKTKKIVSLFTQHVSDGFCPTLYQMDISTRKFKKVFPLDSTNNTNLVEGLSINTLSKGKLHYNSSLRTYMVTYTGIDSDNKLFVVDFYIKEQEGDQLNLIKVNLYKDLFDSSTINEPPTVLFPFVVSVDSNQPFFVNVSANNNPTSFELLNYTNSVSADNTGLVYGSLPVGLHHINYRVRNLVGATTYCLTLNSL